MVNVLKKITIMLAGIVGFMASLVAILSLFATDLPYFQFHEDCSVGLDGGTNALKRLQYNALAFQEFGYEHAGETVYLDVFISPSSRAGGCSLEVEPQGYADEIKSYAFSAALPENFDSPQCLDGETTYIITSDNNDEMGRSSNIQLFDPSKVPLDGTFTNYDREAFYRVTGPFVIQAQFCDGSNFISFKPVLRSEVYWEAVSCTKNSEVARFV